MSVSDMKRWSMVKHAHVHRLDIFFMKWTERVYFDFVACSVLGAEDSCFFSARM